MLLLQSDTHSARKQNIQNSVTVRDSLIEGKKQQALKETDVRSEFSRIQLMHKFNSFSSIIKRKGTRVKRGIT